MQNSMEKILESFIKSGNCTQADAQERISLLLAKGVIDAAAADRLMQVSETYAPTEAVPTVSELIARIDMLEEAFVEFVGMMLS